MARDHKQGDIYYANLTSNGSHVQSGMKPVVIMQNDIGNKFSPTVTVVPLTSKKKSLHLPTHAVIEADEHNGLRCSSVVLGEQITTIPVERMGKRLGKLNKKDFSMVWGAVLNQIAVPERNVG